MLCCIMVKISVVLPVYKGADYLAQSIQSVIDQTFTDWELIIVDDRSPDDSFAIAQKFAAQDKRIKAYQNEVNLKLPGNLNAGFAKAKGEYFTWTSHDNAYLPHAFEVMSAYLDTHADVGLVYADMDNMAADGKVTKGILRPRPEDILYKNCVGAAFMYRARVAQKVGAYDTHTFLAEDYQYWLRISRHAALAYIPETLYNYRRHAQSLTGQRYLQVVKMDIAMRKKFAEDYAVPELDKRTFEDSLYRPLFNATYRRMPLLLVKAFLGRAKGGEVIAYYKQAFPEFIKLTLTHPIKVLRYIGQDIKRVITQLIKRESLTSSMN